MQPPAPPKERGLYPPLEGEGRSREARAGWGDLSTRVVFNAERPSRHLGPHSASLHANRFSPSRGGWGPHVWQPSAWQAMMEYYRCFARRSKSFR
ncbi:hypothetical protein CT676_11570 [Bradyrhizobium sp. MOS001]|nr:hypothetical protein CT676_11570 [Bradyrhizobium sp. MOS001]